MSGSKEPETAIYRLNPFGPVQGQPADCGTRDDVLSFHRGLNHYQPTPLFALPGLAERLGLRHVLVKDESRRFGLGAFKVLGASYAIQKVIEAKHGPGINFFRSGTPPSLRSIRLTTATDGNHGRAVAWCGAQLGIDVIVYVPNNISDSRIDAIKEYGAEVVVVDGTYDDAVRRCAGDAKSEGMQVISDTAWEGYREIPEWIMSGYSTIFTEIEAGLDRLKVHNLDFVFVQAGVGGLAGAAAEFYHRNHGRNGPKLICVEPMDSACILNSIENGDGGVVELQGGQNSIMAGLNCGVPSLSAWPLLKDHFDLFMAVEDSFAVDAMRMLYDPAAGDPQIIAGESGSAGLGGLLGLLKTHGMAPVREKLGICRHSSVLLLNTEGAMDQESFRAVIGGEE